MFKDIARYYNGRGWEYNGMSQLTPYGTGLGPVNAAGGGVYVMQWEHGRFIRVWTFVKPNIPADILNVNFYMLKKMHFSG